MSTGDIVRIVDPQESRAPLRIVNAAAVPVVARLQDEPDLSELLNRIRRRKGLIAVIVIVLMALATTIVLELTPRFTAATFVIVGARQTRIVDVDAVLSGLSADDQTTLSETKVIASRSMAARTVELLSLDRNPEFNETLRPLSALAQYLSPVKDFVAGLIASSSTDLTGEQQAENERVRVVDAFLEDLNVTQEGQTRVIQIAFTSESASTAASVANTLADQYIASQVEAKLRATGQANQWITDRLTELHDKVAASERAVEQYREQIGLVQGKDVALANEEVSEQNSLLVAARAKRAEAEASLRQAEELLSTKNSADSASRVLQSPLIQKLREQEADAQRRLAQASQDLAANHPTLIAMRAEVANVQEKINVEINKIIEGLHGDVAVAAAEEATAAKRLEESKSKVADLSKAGVELNALEREAAANRMLFEAFLSRSKETSDQASLQEPDAQIISRADIPQDPSFPRIPLLLVVSLLTSTFIAVVMALIVESADRRVRSAEQVQQLMGMPTMGFIPKLRTPKWIYGEPEVHVLAKPGSAFAESIRGLHTGLMLARANQPPKVVLITSALPKEGKTVIAVSLARLLASAGHRVVIIDGDFRRPSVHRTFKAPLKPGLMEYLCGSADLESVVHQDRQSTADVIPAGAETRRTTELLESNTMAALLSRLAETYEIVIIDSAPVLAASDVRVLARLVDKTVFLVRWADTRQKTAVAALQQLLHAGADVAGVVISVVDVKRHAQYDFGDAAYNYSHLRRYYSK